MSFLQSISRTKLAIAGLILVVVAFFAVNIFSNTMFKSAQADLTQDDLYTLSDGTRTVLAGIKEPITVRLYFSKALGDKSSLYATYSRRVREILERYVDISKGMVKLQVLNPEPFSDIEDQAMTWGLQGGRLDDSGTMGYFGVVGTNTTDEEQVLPFLDANREAFLEYDLTKMIYTLANPEKKKIGLISGLPLGGWTPEPFSQRRERAWPITSKIGEFFEFERMEPTVKTIPANIGVLMIVHPKDLKDDTLYAIDQFVMRGGKVLLFADGLNEIEALLQQGMYLTRASGFDKLLNAWGVTMVKDRVAGDLDAAQRVSTQHQTGNQSAADYVAWLRLGPNNFNPADVVSADLEGVNMASSAIFEKVPGATTELHPLITTGPRSMQLELRKVQSGPDVLGLLREFKPSGEKMVLAARITGNAKTAFPDGPPPLEAVVDPTQPPPAADAPKAEPPKDERPAQIKETTDGLNVIVVGDADMLHERFWARVQDVFGQQVLVPFANNANFVINALDNLNGSNALIKLRARGQSSRPFTMVEDIRRTAELQFRSKEQELQNKMTEVQGKLNELVGKDRAPGEIKLTSEEDSQINEYRRELVSIRREIRDVQQDLRKDIDRLDAVLKFVNIALIPLLLAGVTLAYALVRRARRVRQQTLH
jgi:ABC-type uncharacterized transport system involved in gliding motility auxiliary subunit